MEVNNNSLLQVLQAVQVQSHRQIDQGKLYAELSSILGYIKSMAECRDMTGR